VSAAANEPGSALESIIAAAVREALDRRLPTLAALGLVPPRFVLPAVASLITGYTEKAIQQKIDSGVWREGHEWKRAPDGKRHVDMQGYERWVQGGRQGE
jgi:hypothetical protein